MKKESLFILVVLVMVMTCEAQITSIVQKVDRWYWYSWEMNEATMPEAEKREVIAELRRRLPLGEQTDQGRYRYLLLRLGDEQTIAEVRREMWSEDLTTAYTAMGMLQNINNPVLIPVLAELLYYPEGLAAEVRGGTVFETRPSWSAARMINIICAREEFNSEVKNWILMQSRAGRTYNSIRALWEANKEAFLRKDYAAVKPPKSVPKSFPPTATNPSPGRVGAPSAK